MGITNTGEVCIKAYTVWTGLMQIQLFCFFKYSCEISSEDNKQLARLRSQMELRCVCKCLLKHLMVRKVSEGGWKGVSDW